MGGFILSLLLCILGFIIAFLVIRSLIQIKRDWPTNSKAWGRMESFEKSLFYIGLLLFVFIPALKDHPAANWYFAKVIIEILPAIAGSTFVAGLLAFMKQLHEIRKIAEQSC